MAASNTPRNGTSLRYNSVFEDATAVATNVLTVLGETSAGVTEYQEIVVNVTLEALKNSLKHEKTWTLPADNVLDANSLPQVTFDLQALVSAMAVDANSKTAEYRFVARYTTGRNASFNDDAGDSKEAMQRWIMEAPPAANSEIETIPFEAVIKVVPGAVDATALKDLNNPAATDVYDSAVMNLFEQALAAGKLGPEVTQGTSDVFDNFVVGDSITVYVKYEIKRTTTVEIDALSAVGAGVAKFKLNNGTVIDAATPLTEVGEPMDRIVAYKFVAA